jgi:hypothetical protein
MARHRKLPSNEHAEAALLGSIVINAEVIPDILSIARPDDFGESTLREVYEKALDLYDQQRPIDAETLYAAGIDPVLVSRLLDAVPTSHHALEYARQVRSYGDKMRLADITRIGFQRCMNGSEPGEIIQFLQTEIAGVHVQTDHAPALLTTWPEQAPPMTWLFQDMIPTKAICEIDAAGGRGKTWFTQILIASLATSRTLLPAFEPAQIVRTLWLQGEDSDEELHRRYNRLATYYEFQDIDHTRWVEQVRLYTEAMPLFTEDGPTEHFHWLANEVRIWNPALLVIDPRAHFFGGDENDNSQVAQFFALLRALDVTVIISHHASKQRQDFPDSATGRGASAARDAARTVFGLYHLTTTEIKQYRISNPHLYTRLELTKSNYAAMAEEAIYLRRSAGGVLAQVDLDADKRAVDADLLGKMARDLTELLADIPEITKRQVIARNQGKPIRESLAEDYGDFATRKNIERAIDHAIDRNWLYIDAELRRGLGDGYLRKTPLEVPF